MTITPTFFFCFLKKRKILAAFFFINFTLIFFISLLSSGTGAGETHITIPQNEVISRQVAFEPISIEDAKDTIHFLDSSGRYQYFHAEKGDVSLKSSWFKETYASEELCLIEGDVVFEVPLIIWTDAAYTDVAAYIRDSQQWCEYWTYTIDTWNRYHWTPDRNGPGNRLTVSYDNYAMKYTDSKLGYNDLGMRIYITALPNVNLINKDSNTTFHFEAYQWQLLSVKAITKESALIGDYKDTFTKTEQSIKIATQDVTKSGGELPTKAGNNVNTQTLINQCGITLGSIDTVGINTGPGVQQGTSLGCTVGVGQLDVSERPGLNQAKLLNLPIRLEPEIRRYPQSIVNNRGVGFEILTKSDWFGGNGQPLGLTAGSIQQSTIERNAGVHVYNKAILQYYEVAFHLYSKVELTARTGARSLLDFPSLERSDLFWNTLITGDTGAVIGLAHKYGIGDFLNELGLNDFLAQYAPYLVIIAIIVILGISAYMFGPLIRRVGGMKRGYEN